MKVTKNKVPYLQSAAIKELPNLLPYEKRVPCFRAVTMRLVEMGLGTESYEILADIGTWDTALDYYLRKVVDWKGIYAAQGSVTHDQTVVYWSPKAASDYSVCLDILHKMDTPGKRIYEAEKDCHSGLVWVVPNPDVMQYGEKQTAIRGPDWRKLGYKYSIENLYGLEGDSIIAWKDVREDEKD